MAVDIRVENSRNDESMMLAEESIAVREAWFTMGLQLLAASVSSIISLSFLHSIGANSEAQQTF